MATKTVNVVGTSEGPPALGTEPQGFLPAQRLPGDGVVGEADLDAPRPARVTVIIPAMNEAPNLPWVLGRLPGGVDEVILVDGHSMDGTPQIARRLLPSIRVIPQRGRGKGAALRTGFEAATGDYIVMIDADGSMDPAEIPWFVNALDGGYQFAKGSRMLPGGGSQDLTAIRRWGNWALVKGVNLMFLVPFTDLCYGFVAFRRDVLQALCLGTHGFEIETELVLRAVKTKLRIAEVPSIEAQRHYGSSNLHTFRDGQRVLRTMMRERFVHGPRTVVDHLHRTSVETPTTSCVAEDVRDQPERALVP